MRCEACGETGNGLGFTMSHACDPAKRTAVAVAAIEVADRLSLRYGVLPGRVIFDALFDSHAGGRTLPVTLAGPHADAFARAQDLGRATRTMRFEWTARDMYSALGSLACLWGMGDDDAGDLAWALLARVGVDWT